MGNSLTKAKVKKTIPQWRVHDDIFYDDHLSNLFSSSVISLGDCVIDYPGNKEKHLTNTYSNKENHRWRHFPDSENSIYNEIDLTDSLNEKRNNRKTIPNDLSKRDLYRGQIGIKNNQIWCSDVLSGCRSRDTLVKSEISAATQSYTDNSKKSYSTDVGTQCNFTCSCTCKSKEISNDLSTCNTKTESMVDQLTNITQNSILNMKSNFSTSVASKAKRIRHSEKRKRYYGSFPKFLDTNPLIRNRDASQQSSIQPKVVKFHDGCGDNDHTYSDKRTPKAHESRLLPSSTTEDEVSFPTDTTVLAEKFDTNSIETTTLKAENPSKFVDTKTFVEKPDGKLRPKVNDPEKVISSSTSTSHRTRLKPSEKQSSCLQSTTSRKSTSHNRDKTYHVIKVRGNIESLRRMGLDETAIYCYRFHMRSDPTFWRIFNRSSDRRIESICRLSACRLHVKCIKAKLAWHEEIAELSIFAETLNNLEKCCKLIDQRFPSFHASYGLGLSQ